MGRLGNRRQSADASESYARFVELGNKGAKRDGLQRLGAMWRAEYDMPPDHLPPKTTACGSR